MSIDTQSQPLKDRIEKALADFTSGRASMHVPPLDTDVDVVLAECSSVLEAAEKRIAELESENEYIRVRFKESDLLFGKLILTMRAAVIEQEHGEGDKAAMDWIFNQLAGPGEFAPESEEDAQEYFNREVEKIDVEFSKCMDYFTKRREGLRAAGISVKGE